MPASSEEREGLGAIAEEGHAPPTMSDSPTRKVNTMPPSGRVPYVVTSPSEFAFASWRLGTRFGSEASRAGVHSSERHSITNEST